MLFSHKEKAEFVKELYYLHDIYSSYLQYPERFFNECAIKNDVAISFDPEGYAYKCWEIIGNKEYSIGKLNSDGGIGNINYKVLNRQLYGADILDDHTCSQCKYLPICHGGCPIQRIENEFECGKNCSCTHYKGCLEEFLKIHINYKNRLLK